MGNLISRFVSVLVNPWGAMRAVKAEGDTASIKPYVLYVAVIGLLSGVISAVMGSIIQPEMVRIGQMPAWTVWIAVAQVPIVLVISSFLNALIVWGIINGLLQGTGAQYKTTFRVLALPVTFSPLAALLAPIPKVGMILLIAVSLWAFIVTVRGIIIVRETKPLRTWITFVLVTVFSLLLFALAAAAAQTLAGGAARPGAGFQGFGDDLFGDDVNFEQELQRLTEEAQRAQ